jgi:hypothetical protein
MKKVLLVSIDEDDHELVARYAAAKRLSSIDAGAARILADWATTQRLRDKARRRAKIRDPRQRKRPRRG